MKKLALKSITQNREHTGTRIRYLLELDNQDHVLEYFFYGKNCEIEWLPERFDPIAVLFLYAALLHGFDIESNYPISQELLYLLTKQVIPQLVACNPTIAHSISIKGPVTNEQFHGTWKGTGVSCGVDSLSTIMEYSNIAFEDYMITHLLYLKVGQHSEIKGHTAETKTAHFLTGLENATAFSKDAGLPLIVGESNYAELVDELFGASSCVPDVVFRNAGSVLILQNYFSKYYYANSYPNLSFFGMSMKDDNAKYDRWLLPNFSTESLHLYSANTNMHRIEKVVSLKDYALSYHYLTVCWRGSKNCGWCEKCVRTMLELDVNGLLDLYRERFDLDVFCERRRDLYTYVYKHRSKNLFFEEIAQKMDEEQLMVPGVVDYLKYYCRKLRDRQFPFSNPYI